MTKPDESKKQTEKVHLDGILSEFRDALEEEIFEVKKSGQSSILLSAGHQINSSGSDFWYRFNVDYAPSLPADTPCKLLIGDDQFDVTVVSVNEDAIIVSSGSPLSVSMGRARLENGATVLMERLIKCIEANATTENVAGLHMLPLDGSVYSSRTINTDTIHYYDECTESQNEAVKSALSNDITYIWGPPGTGKTTVIGNIIDELFKHDRSVLLVSHTNVAVDGAISKAVDAYSGSDQTDSTVYPILRLGVTGDLPDEVTLDYHVKMLGKELYEQKEQKEKEQERLQDRISEILKFIAKDEWINESQLDFVKEDLDKITEYKTTIDKLQSKINDLNLSIKKEKAAHPEHTEYVSLAKSIEEETYTYNSICEQIEANEKTIKELSSKTELAQDEIRKHSIYADLKTQEERYMSASFYEQELNTLRSAIASLENDIPAWREKMSSARKTIAEFEKKNSISKFFSSNTLTDANYTIKHCESQIEDGLEELKRSQRLEEEYTKELDDLLVLQKRIDAVYPSETQEYWNDEIMRLASVIGKAKASIVDLTAKKTFVEKELLDLKEQQDQVKVPYETIHAQQALHDELVDERKTLEDKRMTTHKACLELLEREASLCYSFHSVEYDDDNTLPLFNIYSDLSRAMDSVRSEMASVDLDELKEEKQKTENDLSEIISQLNEIKEKLQELERQAVLSAKVVGTTLTKSYLDETLRERKFDTVILDEASMASIPALWCAAYLSDKNIVIVGDFLQLPPIVLSKGPMAQKWLGKDIFEHSGMMELAKSKTDCPDNFIMLKEQFRMEEDIANLANMYYGEYGGLRTASDIPSRKKDRDEFYSWYSGKKTKGNIHLIDTESLHAWVTGIPQGKNHSRLNLMSACVDVDLAFKFIENKLDALDPETATDAAAASVLIIAPYKPHVQRVKKLIEIEYRNRGFDRDLGYIKAGTIHSFQGSEADIVIFDLVIDEPHYIANLFMTDKEISKNIEKMFNVAITRARFKLYLVGNFAYCQKRAKNNTLSDLLDTLLNKNRIHKIDAKELLPSITFSRPSASSVSGDLKGGTQKLYVGEAFDDAFIEDIRSFKERLIIFSPFLTEQRLSIFLPAFADAINTGKRIIIITKVPSENGKTMQAQAEKCIQELGSIGATVLQRKGMHQKLILVDQDVLWNGSLNPFSYTGTSGEIMQRSANRNLVIDCENLEDISHILQAVDNDYELTCPICGGEMIIREGNNGGFYWQCIEGDYSRNASQQYPKDGILRCKCGAPYVFSMKNEPRWVCSENPRHYQKMREGDLKLEKMAALIPTRADRKAVNQYFFQRRKNRNASRNK